MPMLLQRLRLRHGNFLEWVFALAAPTSLPIADILLKDGLAPSGLLDDPMKAAGQVERLFPFPLEALAIALAVDESLNSSPLRPFQFVRSAVRLNRLCQHGPRLVGRGATHRE